MKTLNGVSFQSSQGWGRQTMHDNFSWADMGPTRNKSKPARLPGDRVDSSNLRLCGRNRKHDHSTEATGRRSQLKNLG